jgi:glycosyltransferase involved in cell wall biosynthesis
MKNNQLSIIICNYNDQDYLERCVKSCVNQHGHEIEIIIVDDGSLKPYEPELLNYLDKVKKLQIIYNTVNRGLSYSRNLGINAAKYDLILPLDTDDYLFPNVTQHMANAMQLDNMVIYGKMIEGVDGHESIPETNPLTKERFIKDNPIYCTSMFTKMAWEKAGGYHVQTDHKLYEDWNFWCKCFMAGTTFFYIDLLVYYHTYRLSSMLKRFEVEKEMIKQRSIQPLFD